MNNLNIGNSNNKTKWPFCFYINKGKNCKPKLRDNQKIITNSWPGIGPAMWPTATTGFVVIPK